MTDALVGDRLTDEGRLGSPEVIASSDMDSEELLASRGADPESFAKLYERLRTAAFRLARRYSLSDDEAIDTVASAFERAYTAIGTFDPARGRFAPWLLRITHNMAVDGARRRARQREDPIARAANAPGTAPDPEAAAIARDELEELRGALARLSVTEQEALTLRYGSSLSSSEIAMVLGKSQSATEKMLARSISKLRRELNNGVK